MKSWWATAGPPAGALQQLAPGCTQHQDVPSADVPAGVYPVVAPPKNDWQTVGAAQVPRCLSSTQSVLDEYTGKRANARHSIRLNSITVLSLWGRATRSMIVVNRFDDDHHSVIVVKAIKAFWHLMIVVNRSQGPVRLVAI